MEHSGAPADGGHEDAPPGHDLGLVHDLPTLLSRRSAVVLLSGASAAFLAACGSSSATGGAGAVQSPSASRPGAGPGGPPPGGDPGGPPPGGAPGSPATADAVDGLIPQETAGPFPGDGSNGVDVLDDSGIVRTDLTRSVDVGSGVADGVPMTLRLRVIDVSGGTGDGRAGAAVYAWHCDAQGRYSMYSAGVESENYLRGVQVADADGWVTFASIFPGCYQGRWPHVHFEVYPDAGSAVAGGSKLRTSQLALPEGACRAVYADERYPQSTANLERLSLDTDTVFADGYSLQLATVEGSAAAGYTATLAVPV